MNDNLSNRYCEKLFYFFEVSVEGDCWLCCPAWLPYKIGNILTDDFDDIWNGEVAQKLRAQVFTGEWNYCNHNLCPLIQANALPLKDAIPREMQPIMNDMPRIVHLSEDQSCNLRCPSCRIEKILHAPGSPKYIKAQTINDKIYDIFFSKPTDFKFQLNMTGSGDPFASSIYRNFLKRIDGKLFPNLTINLLTNAVMFTPKTWKSLTHIHNQLGSCRVSLDAGTKHTYETVTRLGGNWDVLMSNCDFLNDRVPEYDKFQLDFDFVVQKSNYTEMVAYAELCLARFKNAKSIHFSKLNDWNTWSRTEYLEYAVWMPEHPDYNALVDLLDHEIFNDPKIYLGNLSNIRRRK